MTKISFTRRMLKVFRLFRARILPKRIFLIDCGSNDAQPLTRERLDFFFRSTGTPISEISVRSLVPLFYHGPVLVRGVAKTATPTVVRIASRVLDVDEKTCFVEAWHWHTGLEYLLGEANQTRARSVFDRWKKALPQGMERAYIFGTGPSLARALERDWTDGYRIVCNTIVRDAELWHHIDPHAIVAGDGLYHFGLTPFALAFRRDLAARLRESPATVFIYPAMFDVLVRREFDEFQDRLVPIAGGKSTSLHETVLRDFELPELGNVLNLLLLPIACSLSKRVGLWGFDGRAPTVQLFWANSDKHSYPELMNTLRDASPAFFSELVPKDDPEKYLRSVHGDVLTHCLAAAEKDGFTFEMLHKTWTPALARYAVETIGDCPNAKPDRDRIQF